MASKIVDIGAGEYGTKKAHILKLRKREETEGGDRSEADNMVNDMKTFISFTSGK